ncbi:hypothetical protein CXX84_10520 [Arthrobacter sp. AFG7.2]|uniref:hypothetical protein n=1 Tax=Arthrobacter sp. AFG7.2 TaxID=1688693 RepID=UPI000C9DB539|nr:hypothetical protein [Arthrobacter sp. AFG7.2]PNI08360.1 hypothetical protein CXX84_10520 [Arthrobacter sp. AFG7.2]
MTTSVNALALDMLTFSGLLRIIRQPQLAENYEARAKYLLANPAAKDVEETRAWVRLTLQGGAGGLGDMYVQKADGSVDEVLTRQYMELLQKMTDFANGGDEPSSLLQQMGSAMFAHGYTYVRLVEVVPTGKWPFRRGRTMYEVMTAPGVTRLVDSTLLGGAVGYDPRGSRRDMQECQMTARRMFDEGRTDDWVHFSSSQVIPG